ncbi:MAG: VWA domain-containing protein [Deltaproteobacteria bacterium]|nr:VWA domain-containing protein [Deltaproteobacteria bacterium]
MPGSPPGALLSHLLLFARLLRQGGLKATPDRVIEAARSLKLIDFSSPGDFSTALKANFVSRKEELALFDELFARFWLQARPDPAPDGCGDEDEGGEGSGTEKSLTLLQEEPGGDGQEEGEEKKRHLLYSPEESLTAKDFSQLSAEERVVLDRELVRLLSELAERVSRRREPASRGREMDFRRTLRRAVRYGGEILELVRRRRKTKPMKIVVICDVSGSMDASTRFTLQFISRLQRLFHRSEYFVFSTRLTRITDLIKRRNWAEALVGISRRVQDWSGGTRIGYSLRTFNAQFGRQLLSGPAVVIVISDGWDRGDPALLEGEMRHLKRRSRRIIWMNPLLGTPEYRPLCQGMRTALPYVDDFLPASTLGGLKALGEVLTSLGPEGNR